MTAPALVSPSRQAARTAQLRYLEHRIEAEGCACATGGWCQTARDLDAQAEAAWLANERRRREVGR